MKTILNLAAGKLKPLTDEKKPFLVNVDTMYAGHRLDEEENLFNIEHMHKLVDQDIPPNIREHYIKMDVDEFMREKTTMIPDYKYHVDNVDRKFTLNNDYFDGDGRLIIGGNGDVDAAQKLYDHLRYYLKYKIFKNHGIIARYKQLKYIPGYYGVSSDFDNYGGSQIVFMNTESLDYWKHVNKNGDRGFFARDYPLIWMDEPQFVRNWALNDGHPFVVQNVNDGDLELAVKTSKNGNGARKYVNFVYMNEGLMNFTREKSDDCVYVWAYSKENFGAIII